MANAIILCAGNARRFLREGSDKPKCLLSLPAESTILERLIRQLHSRGYSPILGTGCGHDQIVAVTSHFDDVRCVFNPEYRTTNSIVTLWRAREFVTDETLIVNGDLVVEDGVFDCFGQQPFPQLLVKFLNSFSADTYRVVLGEGGHALDMGKDIDAEPSASCAAFLGISRVGSAPLFLREIRSLLDSGDNQTWPTTAYRRMVPEVPVWAVDIGDALFFDVDTSEEYEAAKRSLMHNKNKETCSCPG